MIHWRDEQGDWHETPDASGIGPHPTAIVMPVDDDDDAEGIAAGCPWVAMVTIDEAAPRSRGRRTLAEARRWAEEYIAARMRGGPGDRQARMVPE
jgi:hypothetical protein